MAHIYRMFSIESNHSYVGCTASNMRKRFREHRCLLRSNKHQSPEFQKLWDEQGELAFHIEELEVCGNHKDEKRPREQYWMDWFAERGWLLNVNPRAGSPMPDAPAKAAAARVANGYRPSVESNRKRSIAQLGIPKKKRILTP